MLERHAEMRNWDQPPNLNNSRAIYCTPEQTNLEAVIDELNKFQLIKELTRKQLFRACYGVDAKPPMGFDKFEQYMRKSRLPGREGKREQGAADLIRGLHRARASLHDEFRLYELLARMTGRGEAAQAGFEDYVGDYRFFRLLSDSELVEGELHFGYHSEALIPYHWQRHKRKVRGNDKVFLYAGPVLMMPNMVRFEGFTNGEMRPTFLKRGTPETDELLGKFLTQFERNGDDFAANVVLYRKDAWQRLNPSENAIKNLLRNKAKFSGILE